jgi:poly-gamma-glutamate synthesis protein (capsule biosynthesis protein)
MKKIYLTLIILFIFAGTIAIVLSSKKIHNIVETSQADTEQNSDLYSSSNTTVVNSKHFAPIEQDVFENFYKSTQPPESIGDIKGAIIPHHLLGGYLPATLFSTLQKQKPSTIVLFGPNHFFTGKDKAIATANDWSTYAGNVKTDRKLLDKLIADNIITIDENAIADEHSIFNLIPFIAKSLPNTKVVSFMLRYQTDTTTLNNIVESLKNNLPKDAVIIASIDFSHYQTMSASNFHDELTIQTIKNFDYDRYNKLEIDSVPSLYLLSKLMENYGTQKVAYELHDSSAKLLNNPALASGTSYYSPYFVKGEKENVKITSILNFGDMMLDRNVKKMIDANGADYIFKVLAGEEQRFFSGMDVINTNLEGPFADKRRETTKSIAFRFDPKLIPTLKKYNFNLFTLANNHSLDMSKAGFEEGKANLKKAGIDFYGQQYKVSDENLLIKQIGDFKFGLLGLDDTINLVKISEIKSLIEKAKNQGAEIILASIHWGDEYKEISNTRQRQLAHALIDSGVDVIIGHHPHVVEEMEIYKNHPIFYSLGNFVFDQYFSVSTQQGLGIGLVIKEEGTQKSISTYVFPLQGAKSQVKQMKYYSAIKYFETWTDKSRLGDYKFSNFNLKINF